MKQIGENAGIKDANGELLVSFVVNRIAVDIQCTDELASPPENGHFVALVVSVQTSPNMLNSDLINEFNFSASNFTAIAPDGTTSNASPDTAAIIFCLDDSVLLPYSIGPGENVNGLVLLDLANPSGILVAEDFWTESAWEWAH
ncbi:hypothetical protein E2F48_10145 [Arthrobacter crusticola]|uniref:DUF4352 domain-containing protein n=1 Tax=Arthrobacter crusticola TaxID=2547960 RepID=A0A4R5TWX6_9MICC|nr:hypothetical protein [Arthrobacter crusticola]TDK25598.1 hypothetical protein E2F48_10145 [Arthrobacter crusticola]